MSFWTKIRDTVVKPLAGKAVSAFTGGLIPATVIDNSAQKKASANSQSVTPAPSVGDSILSALTQALQNSGGAGINVSSQSSAGQVRQDSRRRDRGRGGSKSSSRANLPVEYQPSLPNRREPYPSTPMTRVDRSFPLINVPTTQPMPQVDGGLQNRIFDQINTGWDNIFGVMSEKFNDLIGAHKPTTAPGERMINRPTIDLEKGKDYHALPQNDSPVVTKPVTQQPQVPTASKWNRVQKGHFDKPERGGLE